MIYSCFTDDTDFLNVEIPYLVAKKPPETEKEIYISPQKSKFKENLLQHCIRAVDYSLKFGKNGLPIMGSCDWNDGMNNMNDAESVWLAMFLKIVLDGMVEICKKLGMNAKAKEYVNVAAKLSNDIKKNAWAGDRFARVILKNGSFLGAEKDFIDILPQAFSVFADIGTPEMQNTAINTALKHLYDEKTRVIRLLSPPFDTSEVETVGYISSYPSGIRENSGQYTHAAVWLASALLRLGRKDEAKKLISLINPIGYHLDESSAKRYRAEPFVLAGDVYYGENITERAGWTHFTGSAAWIYRTIIECYPEFIVFDDKTSPKPPKSICKADSLTKLRKTEENSTAE